MTPLNKQNNALRKTRLLPLLPAVMLTACAHNSPVCPPASPALPTVPSVSTPMPPVSYSISASEAIKSWRRRLTDTQMMRD